MSVAQTGTYANRTTPLYAPLSSSAENWYKYPAANGEILLVDASGTQMLQSIEGNLYYNNELLARANDLQDIADYSYYPVLNPAGIDFDGHPIVNASTITATGDISGGGALTIGGSIVGGGNITVPGDISGNGNLAVTGSLSGSAVTVTGAIQGGSLSVATLPKPFSPGELQGDSLSVSGAAAVGSVSSTGAIAGTTITGASLTTTGGLDMTNSAINRATSVNISNAGFAPYGQLTSPNGVQLLWNGASVATGAAGDVSQWANFQAVAPILGNGQPISNLASVATTGTITATSNITSTAGYVTAPNLISDNLYQLYDPTGNKPMKILGQNPAGIFFNSLGGGIAAVAAAGKIEATATNDVDLTTTGGDVNVTAYNQVVIDSGNDISLTADPGLNPLYTAAVNLTAKNGNGGQVNIVADPGSVAAFGGVVNVTANGGTITIPQPPPELPISVTVGGEVNITANTGSGAGLYTATSAINLNAASINSYAGAIPPIGSLLGYNFIYGNLGVSICAGLPASGVQFPGTVFISGIGIPGVAGGVRLQSAQGIQMLSDTYIENLYPLDGNGLTIQGRSLPTGYVTIKDLAQLTMNPATALQTDRVTSVSNLGILFQDAIQATTIEPPMATAAGTPNLMIKGNENILGGYQNYVQIQNADTIAFDATGTGALSNVKSINGAAWPPPTGDASLWSQYPQTSTLDASGYGIVNLSTINGQPVGDLTPQGWAAFPAIQNVDISGFAVNAVGAINTVAGAAITSAGALSIFADTSGGNLTLATNGGGNVNIGTGNAGDINIATSGAGNEVTIAGDVVNLQGTQGVRVDAPVLDLAGNNIYNVATLRSSLATNLTVIAEGTGNLNMEGNNITTTSVGNTNLNSTSGSIISTASVNNDMTATNGAVNITANTQVDIGAPVVNLNANINANGTFNASSVAATGAITGASVTVTGDVSSSLFSLNTIGALVSGNQQYDYWVAVNGSDVTGNGSVIKPFATVTGALAATLSISDAIPVNIRVTAGTFTENPTITRNNTFLVGNVGVADAVIIGTVTFDPTATATVSQGMSGITVVGNVVCNDSLAFDINWYIQFCNITSYTAAAINAFSTGSGNNSLILNNTVITQNVTANTAITLNSVRLNAIQVQINNNTTGACISANGTASMSVYGCTLTSAGAATASAHITYINAVGNGSASSFVLNTFTYTASTAGSAKAAFFFNNAGALAGSTVINNNVFNLPGAAALIQRPGTGSIAIAFGANTSSILTIPAAGTGLTYAYTTSTPLRANVLYDSTSSAGTANQVLGAGAAGGTLTWRSLTNQSLGSIPAATNAAVYQNQPLYYNTTTQSINYIAAGDDVIVQPVPATANPVASQRGITYIATSAAGGANFQFSNGGGLTANDAGWYIYIKNGNGTNGGDITLTGALVSGNTVIHMQTSTQNGQIVILTWNGTAFVAY